MLYSLIFNLPPSLLLRFRGVSHCCGRPRVRYKLWTLPNSLDFGARLRGVLALLEGSGRPGVQRGVTRSSLEAAVVGGRLHKASPLTQHTQHLEGVGPAELCVAPGAGVRHLHAGGQGLGKVRIGLVDQLRAAPVDAEALPHGIGRLGNGQVHLVQGVGGVVSTLLPVREVAILHEALLLGVREIRVHLGDVPQELSVAGSTAGLHQDLPVALLRLHNLLYHWELEFSRCPRVHEHRAEVAQRPVGASHHAGFDVIRQLLVIVGILCVVNDDRPRPAGVGLQLQQIVLGVGGLRTVGRPGVDVQCRAVVAG